MKFIAVGSKWINLEQIRSVELVNRPDPRPRIPEGGLPQEEPEREIKVVWNGGECENFRAGEAEAILLELGVDPTNFYARSL